MLATAETKRGQAQRRLQRGRGQPRPQERHGKARRCAPSSGDVEDNVVAVLGLTFKADTDDVRETPAFALIEGLKQAGISVRVFDPQGMAHARQMLTDVEFCDSALDACSGADCAVIATEWQEFRALDVKTLARVMRGRTIVDLRNLLDHDAFADEGFVVHSIGRPARLPARRACAWR